MNKTSPIYNVSNFSVQPKLVKCRKCGGDAMLCQSKANGKWFTVDQTAPGQWVWHTCKPKTQPVVDTNAQDLADEEDAMGQWEERQIYGDNHGWN